MKDGRIEYPEKFVVLDIPARRGYFPKVYPKEDSEKDEKIEFAANNSPIWSLSSFVVPPIFSLILFGKSVISIPIYQFQFEFIVYYQYIEKLASGRNEKNSFGIISRILRPFPIFLMLSQRLNSSSTQWKCKILFLNNLNSLQAKENY